MSKFLGLALDENAIRLPLRYFTEEILKVTFIILGLSILLLNWRQRLVLSERAGLAQCRSGFIRASY